MSVLEKAVPKVKAAEEEASEEPEDLVDPMQTLRDKCAQDKHAVQLAEKLQQCNDRVNSRSKTTETCAEELMDLIHAIDHCVAHDLFKHLK